METPRMKLKSINEYFSTLNNTKSDDLSKIRHIYEENEYDYGCSMIYFDPKLTEHILMQIDEEDLHENGLEDEPHISLLYGIHDGKQNPELDSDKYKEIIKISKKFTGDMILSNISLFKNEEFDVLKFDVQNDSLAVVNKELKDNFEYTSKFLDYKPHVTLAYLKPGKGEKYVEKFEGTELLATPIKIVYSRPERDSIEENL